MRYFTLPAADSTPVSASYSALSDFIKDVDLLYHEATFAKDSEALAKKTKHSTAEQAALIAKKAYKENRPIIEVAAEETDLTKSKLEKLLDPSKLAKGGI